MKALVTGAAGFVGINLVKRLLNLGYDVIGVDSEINSCERNVFEVKSMAFDNERFRYYNEDLCKSNVCDDLCKDVKFVFHQAALGSVPRSVENPVATMQNNVMSTALLLEAARKAGVVRFVYASSASVYGNVDRVQTLVETMNTNPYNPYAVSKLACEELVKVYWKVYKFPTVSLRYFNVFGPWQNPEGDYAAVVPKFITMMLEGKQPVIYGSGEQVRDFTFVDNVVSANILAARSGIHASGKTFNISAQYLTSVNSLFKMIKYEIGTVVMPKYEGARKGDVMGSASDISAAMINLDYLPIVQISKGIERTVQWYKESYQELDKAS
jgi:UDP-glucose 4-epimerase